MHLGNGALTPECAALTAGVAAIGLAAAAWSASKAPAASNRWLAAGTYGAAIFAAQMVNVPLLPYSSGHLVGGVLLAVALGPGLGALTMGVVLALQAVLLGDGGVLALGANIINMALLPAGVVAAGQRFWRDDAKLAWSAARHGLEGALSIVLAAMLLVLEVALFRGKRSELSSFAGELLQAHVVIGLAEGALTAAIVYGFLRAGVGSTATPAWKMTTALGVAALFAVVAASWGSDLPDGYEAAAERSQWSALLGDSSHQLALWQNAVVETISAVVPMETMLAIVSTLAAGMVCCAVGWVLRRQQVSREA